MKRKLNKKHLILERGRKWILFKRIIFTLLALVILPMWSMAQNSEIGGQVSDEDGSPLPGVTVVIVGKQGGVITDVDGKYSIAVKSGEQMIFSFIGMESQVVKYNGEPMVNVTLKTKVDELDEVTVVAFGTQKKESVIASVTTVKPAELKVPSSNLTTALAGRMSGIISYQRSGEPGKDNAEFFIRGVTTFGYKKSPLILIDGIELSTTDLARLQPDDIASFSIMKDATATALYGARGANGVILVTTKEGKEGPIKFNMRYEQSLSKPTQMIDVVDPVTYMKMHNEAIATRNPLAKRAYSLEKIHKTQDPDRNQMVYPATDWLKQMFKSSTINHRFNFNASGGGRVARYYLAGTYNTDNGILREDKTNNFDNNVRFNRISLRSNVNIQATKTTEVIVRFSGSFDDYNGPLDSGEDLFKKALKTNPVLFPAFYTPDAKHANAKHVLFGNAGAGNYINPYADMVRGYKDESRSMILAAVELKQDLNFITEGLQARVMGNTNRESFYNVSRSFNPFFYTLNNYDHGTDSYQLFPLNPNSGTEYLGYSEGDKRIVSSLYFEGALNYNRTFKEKHAVTGMLVGILREEKMANAGNLQKSLAYRNAGLSGRFTYAYDDRYFTEFNFGYNGSERFAKKERFGFFPSVGLGWYASNESFMKSLQNVISKLKFKGTYGLVGNDAIGGPDDRFFYISQVNMNKDENGIRFGEDFDRYIKGIGIDRYSNSDISWETAKMADIGVELGLFGKVDIQADYFHEYRKNILMNRSQVPASLGLQAPLRANVGEASSQGVDLSVDFKHNFDTGFWLTSRANFTYAKSQYEVYEELDWNGAGMPWRSRVGRSLKQRYGYIAERLFVDEADIAISPKQTFGEYMGGDIKYKDINEDGIIDENDMVPIGYPETPEIVYGFGASMGYKGIDFSFFFQGSARSSFFIDPFKTAPFITLVDNEKKDYRRNNNAMLTAWANDHWSEENRNIYAAWPRLSNEEVKNNTQTSTWFLRNGSFLRLKSVELGYTLNKKSFIKKIGLESLRFYLSGTNLLQISNFKLWDAEMGGNGLGYPIQQVYNVGLNVNF